MIRIALFIMAALVATIPGFIIATFFLKSRSMEFKMEDTVTTFMSVAPTPWKVGLVSLNFVTFGAICAACWSYVS